MSAINPILRRRNGKPQSCEPCRISKIRCDHRTPICSRCVARGMNSSCSYHPAPLTKPRTKSAIGSSAAPRQPQNISSLPVSPQNENGPSQTPVSTTWSPWSGRASPVTDNEYMGSTSFSAVIDDDRDVVNRHISQPSKEKAIHGMGSCPTISEEQIVAGMGVLGLFIEVPDIGDVIRRYHNVTFAYMVPPPITEACAASIQEVFHGAAGKPSRKQLRRHVLDICDNTNRPLMLFPPVPASEYHTLFTGPNLRWEVVGFVLAMLGLALKYNARRGTEIHLAPSREQIWKPIAKRILEAVEYCATVCESCNSTSHQALWLLYCQAHLKNEVLGDLRMLLPSYRCEIY